MNQDMNREAYVSVLFIRTVHPELVTFEVHISSHLLAFTEANEIVYGTTTLSSSFPVTVLT